MIFTWSNVQQQLIKEPTGFVSCMNAFNSFSSSLDDSVLINLMSKECEEMGRMLSWSSITRHRSHEARDRINLTLKSNWLIYIDGSFKAVHTFHWNVPLRLVGILSCIVHAHPCTWCEAVLMKWWTSTAEGLHLHLPLFQ